jgi:O-antigen/teichoic acid export membrane protein
MVSVAMAQAASSPLMYNRVRLSPPSMTLCVIGVLWWAGQLTPESGAIGQLTTSLIVNLLLLVWIIRQFRPRIAGTFAEMARLLDYGLRSYGLDALGLLATNADRLIVLYMLSAHEMGLYASALSLALTIAVVPSAVSAMLLPRATGRPVERIVELSGLAARASLASMACIAIPLMYVGPPLLGAVYGADFLEAGTAFRWLVAATVLGGVAGILEQIYLAGGMPGRAGALQAVGLLFGAAITIYSTRTMGLDGAAFGIAIAAALRLFLTYAGIRLISRARRPSLLPRLSDVAFVIGVVRTRLSETR